MPSPPSVASYLSPQPTVRPYFPSGDSQAVLGYSLELACWARRRRGCRRSCRTGPWGWSRQRLPEFAVRRGVVKPEFVQREVVVGRRCPDHRPDDRHGVGELPHSRAGHRVERLIALRDAGCCVVARAQLQRTFAGVPGDVRELQRARGFGVDDRRLRSWASAAAGRGRRSVRHSASPRSMRPTAVLCRFRWPRSP